MSQRKGIKSLIIWSKLTKRALSIGMGEISMAGQDHAPGYAKSHSSFIAPAGHATLCAERRSCQPSRTGGRLHAVVSDPSKRLLVLLLTLVFLAGCSQASALLREQKIGRSAETVRVLLMPAEIELAELVSGGLEEPKADWAAAANEYVTEALRAELSARNAVLVPYDPPAQESEKAYRHGQLVKLHNAVAAAIIRHKSSAEFKLPTKEGKLDWTLGPGASILREDYAADYALFIYIRDTYTSGGRTALSVLLSLLYAFPILPGSGLQGFASLVDLRSGEFVWFKRLLSASGDLRSAEPAREAVKNLLTELPL